MKCSCGSENRAGRRFCSECGAALSVPCAACGFANEGDDKFCGGCGQSLRPVAAAVVPKPDAPVEAAAPAPPLERPAISAPVTYTPKHLAEKILTTRSALEGERKQVTVLFADLKGSMELLAERDPEDARKLLDAVLERMIEAVDHYEGTVNQVLGDGIMALFGAPLALEEHAARACYAALAMQKSIRRYAGERGTGPAVRIRVGLNSGEVVVRAIGSDLHMDYTAIGQTTHLAARMEQTAAPGSILLTPATLRHVDGYVHVRSLGPVAVKGVAAPIEVFELLGQSSLRSRLEVSFSRGLTPYVGREEERLALPRVLARAEAGQGQVVALVGEAGAGKSRLLWEFVHSDHTRGWLVLESRSVSYGKATTYLPVIDLLKGYFQLGDRTEPGQIRDVVTARLTVLDPALGSAVSPLLSLLNVPVDDQQWAALDPSQRRRRTLDAVKDVLVCESRQRPLLTVFEDLHWIDSETRALLDELVEVLSDQRILLCVNYRPEYEHGWAVHPFYTEIRVDPLGPGNAEALLRALLGRSDDLAELRRHLIERAQGNPFFLEESVRTLVETGTLVGEPGAYRLVKPLTSIQIPGTVQSIIAARIDRLPPELKRLLQEASVVGRDVPFALLAAIGELSERELRQRLAQLQDAQFVLETRFYPELEHTFTHALTHDVAYASLLHERRRALHTAMVDGIERLYPDRLGEHVERLADHAYRGEEWARAVRYDREAGAKALARSAHPEAVTSFERALSALVRLPETRDTLEQGIDVRFSLRNSLWPLGELQRLHEHLRQAEITAEALGDQRRLGQVSAYMSQFFAWMGDHARAVEVGKRTLTIAAQLDDFPLQVGANFRLGQAWYARGEYRRALEVLGRNITALQGDDLHRRLGMTGLPSVLSRAWLVWCLAELGEFVEARDRAEESLRIADFVEHPFDLVVASFAVGIAGLRGGELHAALPALERGIELCKLGHVPFWFPLIASCLGYGYALSGRLDEALPLLQQGVKQHADMRLMGVHSLLVGWHGEAALYAGRLEEASTLAAEALDLACRYGERGHEAWAHRLQGAIAAHRAGDHAAVAEGAYHRAIALADELGMRPLVARSYLELGRLQERTGDRQGADKSLSAASALFESLGVPASPGARPA
jgi:class 3 adenylate cyclase/tetratricopeptide (TPR) repeat protein